MTWQADYFDLLHRVEALESAQVDAKARVADLETAEPRPGIVWSANGEAGDSMGRCEICGTELAEPHSWEACARVSAAHDLATVNRMVDVEIRADETRRKLGDVGRELLAEREAKQHLQHCLNDIAHVDAAGVWFWQGEGDQPASLSCPVVMGADTLRAMLARAEELQALANDAVELVSSAAPLTWSAGLSEDAHAWEKRAAAWLATSGRLDAKERA